MSNFLKDLKKSLAFGEKPLLRIVKLFLAHSIPYFLLYWGFQHLSSKNVDFIQVIITSIIFGVLMTISNQYSTYKAAHKEELKEANQS